MRSDPSTPRRSGRAEGRIWKTSEAGHGTCQKNPIRASGRASRIRFGTRIMW